MKAKTSKPKRSLKAGKKLPSVQPKAVNAYLTISDVR